MQSVVITLEREVVAILITLLGTGLRKTELSNLRYDDSHIEEDYVKVLGKGLRERIVPIGALVQEVMWRYVFHICFIVCVHSP